MPTESRQSIGEEISSLATRNRRQRRNAIPTAALPNRWVRITRLCTEMQQSTHKSRSTSKNTL
jgi:hypothetical protein